MRLRYRAAAFFALAVVAITCTESTTGPHSATGDGTRGSVSMSPQFSPEAAKAYRALAASGIDITEIHIVLTGADGSTRDTVIAFPVGTDSIQIDIPVPLSAVGQAFTALFELRTADHIVLFRGTMVVVARSARSFATPPPIVTLVYAGPGQTTKAVTVGKPDSSAIGSNTLTYSASAVDSSGAPVPNLLVGWTSGDTTIATVTSTGNSTAAVHLTGKRGTTIITASTPLGIIGTTTLTVVPPATQLIVISGGGQTAPATTTLPVPFVVEARAADNLPAPGTPITFSPVTVAADRCRSADHASFT